MRFSLHLSAASADPEVSQSADPYTFHLIRNGVTSQSQMKCAALFHYNYITRLNGRSGNARNLSPNEVTCRLNHDVTCASGCDIKGVKLGLSCQDKNIGWGWVRAGHWEGGESCTAGRCTTKKKERWSIEDEGTRVFRNVGSHLPVYTASHPGSTESPEWEPQIYHKTCCPAA